MRGGDDNEPVLMPPIFTKMEEYMKEKTELNSDDLTKIIESLPRNPPSSEFIDYQGMCRTLFKDGTDAVSKLYQIGNIANRIERTYPDKLLFMNFKSHNIFKEDSRKSLFSIITTTKPKYICLTEALVPTSIADMANHNAESVDMSQRDPRDYDSEEDIEKDKNENSNTAVVSIAYIHRIDNSLEDKVEQPYKAYKKFTAKKMGQNKGEVSILEDVWIAFFKSEGYKWIIFANPRRCPYGKNWGNCIISKEEPLRATIVQMTPIKKHTLSGMTDDGDSETRCMIHAEFLKDNILCTHLEDKVSEKRIKQTDQIIKYIDSSVVPNSKNITLVGDLNAINEKSYKPRELLLLNKLSPQPVPTDAVHLLNDFFKENVPLINKGQKYESLYQKCVSHAYSNLYTKSLLIFTDATDFDHQPLLLVKPITVKERVNIIQSTNIK